MYKKDPFTSLNPGDSVILNKELLRKSGLNKPKLLPSAIHIASAISSYARTIINEYKNIPGNPCIMSDTDSVVLTHPLPNNSIGKDLGLMKLEHEIVEGLIIRKNLYCIKTSDNQVIIKSSGVDSSRLNYDSFVKLINGETLTIERTHFNVD